MGLNWPIGAAYGPGGDFYGTLTSKTILGFQYYYLPKGLYILLPVTGQTIQVCSSGTTYSTWIASNVGGLIWSDGVDVRIYNSNATPIVAQYLMIN